MPTEPATNEKRSDSGAECTLKPGAKLWISGIGRILGPGAVELLMFIDKTASLKEACKETGMSYSKGRKLVATMERELGCELVAKRQGGDGGGSTTLTATGRDLVRRYAVFEKECAASIQSAFDRHFGDFVY